MEDDLEQHHNPANTATSSVYRGSGTESDPFLLEFLPGDPDNPRSFSAMKRWYITFMVTMSVLATTLASPAYSGSPEELISHFHISNEIIALGISLFVLGFAIGPAFWAPLSELYGRKILFITTHASRWLLLLRQQAPIRQLP